MFLGECFIFTLHPEMKVFYTKGGEGNCQLLTEEFLAMGGSTGQFLLLFSYSLCSCSCSWNI